MRTAAENLANLVVDVVGTGRNGDGQAGTLREAAR